MNLNLTLMNRLGGAGQRVNAPASTSGRVLPTPVRRPHAGRRRGCRTAVSTAIEAPSSGGPVQDRDDAAASASDQQDEVDDEMLRRYKEQQRRYRKSAVASVCLNCTAKVYVGDSCKQCGHHTSNDALLQQICAVLPSSSTGAPTSHILLAWDTCFDQHAMPPVTGEDYELGTYRTFIHPERPERAGVIIRNMQDSRLVDYCRRVACREARWEELVAVHTTRYVEAIRAASQLAADKNKLFLVGEEGYLVPSSWQLLRLAAGTAAELATMLMRGEGDGAAAVLRPPGHLSHADGTAGWCFVNNAAVAVRAAQKAGARRVAVVDWGVHHGQGTQDIFLSDDSVLTISLHRYEQGRFFPGTGTAEEIGVERGTGYNINIPWDTHGLAGNDYMAAFRHVVLPALHDFDPQLIVVAAGFDTAEGDPVGAMQLTVETYATLTRALHDVAPTLVLLEGGYNLYTIADCFHECVRTLVEPQVATPIQMDPAKVRGGEQPTRTGLLGIAAALQAVADYWPSLQPLTFEELMVQYDCLGALTYLEEVMALRPAPPQTLLKLPKL